MLRSTVRLDVTDEHLDNLKKVTNSNTNNGMINHVLKHYLELLERIERKDRIIGRLQDQLDDAHDVIGNTNNALKKLFDFNEEIAKR